MNMSFKMNCEFKLETGEHGRRNSGFTATWISAIAVAVQAAVAILTYLR